MSGSGNNPAWQPARMPLPAQQGVVHQIASIRSRGVQPQPHPAPLPALNLGQQLPQIVPQIFSLDDVQTQILGIHQNVSNAQYQVAMAEIQRQLLQDVADEKAQLLALAAQMNVTTSTFQPTIWELQQRQAPPRPSTPAPPLPNIDPAVIAGILQQAQALLGQVHAQFQNLAATSSTSSTSQTPTQNWTA
jgi:hypothetical protein